MVSVKCLNDVTAAVEGGTKKLLKGNTYDLPDDVAKELARDGYVEITNPSARLQEQTEMANPNDTAESRGRFESVPEVGDPNAQAVRPNVTEEEQGEQVDIYAEHLAAQKGIEQAVADRIGDTFKEPGEKGKDDAAKSGKTPTGKVVIDAADDEHVALVTEEKPKTKPASK